VSTVEALSTPSAPHPAAGKVHAYDDAGRKTAITYPGGANQVKYASHSAVRLSTVTDWSLLHTLELR